LAPLRIPDRFVGGLEAAARLTDDQVERIEACLAEAPPRLASLQLEQRIAAAVPDLGDLVSALVDALLSLASLVEDTGDVDQLASDLSEAEALAVPERDRGDVARRFRSLLLIGPIALAAHARELVLEHERVFHDARILTDIRPVFGQEIDGRPAAAALVSSLKLSFHRPDGPVEALYFGMDYDDLLQLRDVTERALRKTEVLKSLLEDTGIAYWERYDDEVDDAASD